MTQPYEFQPQHSGLTRLSVNEVAAQRAAIGALGLSDMQAALTDVAFNFDISDGRGVNAFTVEDTGIFGGARLYFLSQNNIEGFPTAFLNLTAEEGWTLNVGGSSLNISGSTFSIAAPNYSVQNPEAFQTAIGHRFDLFTPNGYQSFIVSQNEGDGWAVFNFHSSSGGATAYCTCDGDNGFSAGKGTGAVYVSDGYASIGVGSFFIQFQASGNGYYVSNPTGFRKAIEATSSGEALFYAIALGGS